MHYNVKKPGDTQWSDLVTGSLTAEVHAGRIGWNWRVKRSGETRERSVLELAEAESYGIGTQGEVSDETKSRNPPPDILCYLLAGNQQTGPYTPNQIRSMWTNGQVTADALYWFEGLKEWFPIRGFCQQPAPQIGSTSDTVAGSTIACSYILALLLPFFGFFAGIYLVLKKQAGHGVACMALSAFAFFVFFSILSR